MLKFQNDYEICDTIFKKLQRLFRIFFKSRESIMGWQQAFGVVEVFNTLFVVYVTFLKCVG